MSTKTTVAVVATILFHIAGPALSHEAEAGAPTKAAADAGRVAICEPGTWSLHAYSSYSFGDQAGDIFQTRVGGERHWDDGLALEVSGMLGYFDADPIQKEAEE